LASASTFKARVLTAGSWSLGGHIFSQLLRLGSNLLMTRLLEPEAFGLLGIVIVLMIGFALFSDIGISQNIIRSEKGLDPEFLNTAWTVQILRGFFIWIVACILAALIPIFAKVGFIKAGTVYSNPMLPWIIVTYALSAIVQGFSSTKIATARRDMHAKKITQIEIVSQLVALFVMVGLAWHTRSIWALVIGGLTSALIGCLLSHWWLPGAANSFAWNRTALSELISFGKWIFLSSIIGFLCINGDRLLLGGMVDAKLLGVYTIAFMLINAVQMVMQMMSINIAFPALSEVVRERPADLAKMTNKLQMFGDVFLVSICGFIIASGEVIVSLLYDARYKDSGFILCALAVGAIGLRYQIVEQCYLSLGKPEINTLTNVFRFFVLYIGVPVGFYYWQFNGALAVIVLSQYAGWPAAIYFKIKYKIFSTKNELLVFPLLFLGMIIGYAFKLVVQAAES
jgi:O-antigen/teichoic acid export membrane protein